MIPEFVRNFYFSPMLMFTKYNRTANHILIQVDISASHKTIPRVRVHVLIGCICEKAGDCLPIRVNIDHIPSKNDEFFTKANMSIL